MLIFKKRDTINNFSKNRREKGKKIGFIPTMGALHNGHISLIKEAKKNNDITVCSIFVNPTQFNNKEDLEKYPDTLRKDIYMLLEAGCDALFLPEVEDIYPNGMESYSPANVGYILDILEGAFRPGHFEGMMQVVETLLRIVEPDNQYMGEKDYQQLMIVRKMVQERGIKTNIVGCPIIREKDGLAMSSRNMRLSNEGRKRGLILSKTLHHIKTHLSEKSIKEWESWATETMNRQDNTKVEYIEIKDKNSLLEPENKENLVALTAVWVDGIRLIDNLILN